MGVSGGHSSGNLVRVRAGSTQKENCHRKGLGCAGQTQQLPSVLSARADLLCSAHGLQTAPASSAASPVHLPPWNLLGGVGGGMQGCYAPHSQCAALEHIRRPGLGGRGPQPSSGKRSGGNAGPATHPEGPAWNSVAEASGLGAPGPTNPAGGWRLQPQTPVSPDLHPGSQICTPAGRLFPPAPNWGHSL